MAYDVTNQEITIEQYVDKLEPIAKTIFDSLKNGLRKDTQWEDLTSVEQLPMLDAAKNVVICQLAETKASGMTFFEDFFFGVE